jgi:hypothetical protein
MTIADELRAAAERLRDEQATYDVVAGPTDPGLRLLIADVLDNVAAGIDGMLEVGSSSERHLADYYRREIALARAINGSSA